MKQLYKFKFTSNALDVINIINELTLGSKIVILNNDFSRLTCENVLYGFVFEPLGIPINIIVDYNSIRNLIESNTNDNEYVIIQDDLNNMFITFLDGNLKVAIYENYHSSSHIPRVVSKLIDYNNKNGKLFSNAIPPYSIFTNNDGKLHWSNEMHTIGESLLIDTDKTLVNCSDTALSENVIYDLKGFVDPKLLNVHSKISDSTYSFATRRELIGPNYDTHYEQYTNVLLLISSTISNIGTLVQYHESQPL